MKGISPIIAIIIILLITIAIAGAAYAYISIIWGRTTEGLQLVSSDCASNGTVSFIVRNIGTKAITTMTVTETSPGSGGADVVPTTINPGETAEIHDDCTTGSMCIYKVFAGGQSQELYAQC